MRECYKYDKEITDVLVITGACALIRSGLVFGSAVHLDLQTRYDDLDGLDAFIGKFYFNPDIDYEFALTPSPANPKLLLPSKERALVECILHPDWIDEGLLIEGLKTYIEQFWDGQKLYEAANHFGLSTETLEYWLQEAKDDYEV